MLIDPNETTVADLIVVMKGHVFCPACKMTGMSNKAPCELCNGVGQLHIEQVPEQIRADLAKQVLASLQGECNCDDCKGGKEGGKQIQHTKGHRPSQETKVKEEGGFVL